MNRAILTKLGWRSIANRDALSSMILKEKYGGWTSLRLSLNPRIWSPTWRDVCSVVDVLAEGTTWQVVTSDTVLFWMDR